MPVKNSESAVVGEWRGSAIRVNAHLIPRFLWQTASIDVFVDEQCVLRTGGKLKLVRTVSSPFEHLGSSHVAKLKWGFAGIRSFPYKLMIDQTEVTESRVHIQNWYISFVAAVAVLLVIAYTLPW
jgi:hypothetical protein